MSEDSDFTKLQWKQSEKKWRKAIGLAKKRICFDDITGWDSLKIVERCGYCGIFYCPDSLDSKGKKNICPLFSEKMCSNNYEGNKTAFARFVHTMVDIKHHRLDKETLAIDWTSALKEAMAILSAIMEDGKKRGFC